MTVGDAATVALTWDSISIASAWAVAGTSGVGASAGVAPTKAAATVAGISGVGAGGGVEQAIANMEQAQATKARIGRTSMGNPLTVFLGWRHSSQLPTALANEPCKGAQCALN